MINTVYYSEVFTLRAECWKATAIHTAQELFERWVKTSPREAKHYEERFKRFFVDNIAKSGGIYLFIVTVDQLPYFLIDITENNLDQYLVKAVQPAVNSNYPESGVRLHMYIYNIPKKDDHV